MRNKKKQRNFWQTLMLSIIAQLWPEKVSVTFAAPCPAETPLYGQVDLSIVSDEVN